MSLCHFIKESLVGHQFLEGALLGYPTLVEYDDTVAMADGGEAVGDDHTRALQGVEVVADRLLCDIVECTRGLVEEDDVGLRDQGSRNEQALLLSATKSATTLAHHGVKSHRHATHIVLKTGQAQSLPCFIMGSPGGRDGDIMEQVAREQTATLQTAAYPAAQRGLVDLRQVVVHIRLA